jgi:hypothetical protein
MSKELDKPKQMETHTEESTFEILCKNKTLEERNNAVETELARWKVFRDEKKAELEEKRKAEDAELARWKADREAREAEWTRMKAEFDKSQPPTTFAMKGNSFTTTQRSEALLNEEETALKTLASYNVKVEEKIIYVGDDTGLGLWVLIEFLMTHYGYTTMSLEENPQTRRKSKAIFIAFCFFILLVLVATIAFLGIAVTIFLIGLLLCTLWLFGPYSNSTINSNRNPQGGVGTMRRKMTKTWK